MSQSQAQKSKRQQLLEARARSLAQRVARREPRRKEDFEVALFAVGAERFGLPVAALREVLALPPITALPLGCPWIAGVAQLRGVLVTVVDLGVWFDVPGRGRPTYLVSLEMAGRVLALSVDEVLGFRSVSNDELTAAEAGTAAASARPIRALTSDLLTILDPEALFEHPELRFE
ncbi:MAG: chemotaxis protein CheW [Myxococcales bacterium]|nr:chemotaxis protein CheW [Myxococcales bacterium]